MWVPSSRLTYLQLGWFVHCHVTCWFSGVYVLGCGVWRVGIFVGRQFVVFLGDCWLACFLMVSPMFVRNFWRESFGLLGEVREVLESFLLYSNHSPSIRSFCSFSHGVSPVSSGSPQGSTPSSPKTRCWGSEFLKEICQVIQFGFPYFPPVEKKTSCLGFIGDRYYPAMWEL